MDPIAYAEVVVAGPTGWPDQTFHYGIPPGQILRPGHVVWVPFGDQRRQGIIVAIADKSPIDLVRLLVGPAVSEPLLWPYQIALGRWIAETYVSPLADALFAMLPPGVRQRTDAKLSLGQWPQSGTTGPRDDAERAIVDFVAEQGRARLRDLRRRLAITDDAIAILVRRGVLERRVVVPAPSRATHVPLVIRLTETGTQLLTDAAWAAKAPRQHEVLAFLRERHDAGDKTVTFDAVRREIGAELNALHRLLERGAIRAVDEPVPRQRSAEAAHSVEPNLTPEQTRAIEDIELAPPGSAHLLFGITGSGKTEVYLRLIERCLTRGEGAIVLVPEIGLTPQALHRFGTRFPGEVAVMHSRQSPAERITTWRRVMRGDARIVVGSRLGIFAPVPRLGLVVVDEEHEWTYKHDWPPRYHARDTALALGRISGARVVLGSATPEVTTMHLALTGQISLNRLRHRATGARLPEMRVVDMRAELRSGNTGLISRDLAGEIALAVSRDEQAIVFLNRRGTATIVLCRDCGHVETCRRCDSSLVFHVATAELLCHLCGRRRSAPERCPSCRGSRIRHLGAGTQRVEAEIRALFPDARVVRWDADIARAQREPGSVLSDFANHRADILVGTQSVAKGLDIPRITVVGAVNADMSLFLPDYRSGERTYQLLTQVAGRAGRGERPGQVIVQSYRPDSAYLRFAVAHDFDGFIGAELAFRLENGYPPFSRLVRIVYAAGSEGAARREIAARGAQIRGLIRQRGLVGTSILGPSPCYRQRVAGRWRWQIIVRGDAATDVIRELRWPPGWSVDVDPVTMA